ncbi:MAG: M48 family metalloprotease [Candidatus Methanomethylophilaceae archaeon]|nr:M48 family metalloprotease [Candidatus Methanomethylophilaceae archaeon]
MRFWRLRTLSMFIYMTLLLMIIGAILSYCFRFSIYIMGTIMISLSVIMSLYSYYACKRNALRANRARIVDQYEEPRLYNTVKTVAMKYNLPMPEVGIVESWTPNAFATGRNPKDAAVVATRGLLEMLPDDELEGVIAHEMAHVKDRDILVMSFASMMASLISNLSYIAYFALIFSGDRDRNPLISIAGALVVYIVMPIAAIMVQLGISRSREYLADETGGRTIQNPRALARALEHIEKGESAYRNATKAGRRNENDPFDTRGQDHPKNIYDCANMWISNPLRGGGLSNLFSTHPPMEERIRRLNELADKMGL